MSFPKSNISQLLEEFEDPNFAKLIELAEIIEKQGDEVFETSSDSKELIAMIKAYENQIEDMEANALNNLKSIIDQNSDQYQIDENFVLPSQTAVGNHAREKLNTFKFLAMLKMLSDNRHQEAYELFNSFTNLQKISYEDDIRKALKNARLMGNEGIELGLNEMLKNCQKIYVTTYDKVINENVLKNYLSARPNLIFKNSERQKLIKDIEKDNANIARQIEFLDAVKMGLKGRVYLNREQRINILYAALKKIYLEIDTESHIEGIQLKKYIESEMLILENQFGFERNKPIPENDIEQSNIVANDIIKKETQRREDRKKKREYVISELNEALKTNNFNRIKKCLSGNELNAEELEFIFNIKNKNDVLLSDILIEKDTNFFLNVLGSSRDLSIPVISSLIKFFMNDINDPSSLNKIVELLTMSFNIQPPPTQNELIKILNTVNIKGDSLLLLLSKKGLEKKQKEEGKTINELIDKIFISYQDAAAPILKIIDQDARTLLHLYANNDIEKLSELWAMLPEKEKKLHLKSHDAQGFTFLDILIKRNYEDKEIEKFLDIYPVEERLKILQELKNKNKPPPSPQKVKEIQSKNIPKKIHFIWVGGPIPKKYLENINAYCEMAKANGYEVHLWTDNEKNYKKTADKEEIYPSGLKLRNINELKPGVKEHYGAFDKNNPKEISERTFWNCIHREMVGTKNFAAVSDLLRLEILNQEGGLYLDTDMPLALHERSVKMIQREQVKKVDQSKTSPLYSQTFLGSEQQKVDRAERTKLLTGAKLHSEDRTSFKMPEASNGFLTLEVENEVGQKGLINCAIASSPGHVICENAARTIMTNYQGLDEREGLTRSGTLMPLMDLKRKAYESSNLPFRSSITIAASGPGALRSSIEDYMKKNNVAKDQESSFYFPLNNDKNMELGSIVVKCDNTWLKLGKKPTSFEM